MVFAFAGDSTITSLFAVVAMVALTQSTDWVHRILRLVSRGGRARVERVPPNRNARRRLGRIRWVTPWPLVPFVPCAEDANGPSRWPATEYSRFVQRAPPH